jgi:hypothetical protein
MDGWVGDAVAVSKFQNGRPSMMAFHATLSTKPILSALQLQGPKSDTLKIEN